MQPTVHITADAQDVTAAVQSRLLSLRLTDEAGMQSDTLELMLDDRQGQLALPRTGVQLQVALGYASAPLLPLGRFTVDEIELDHPPMSLIIRGRAADLRQSLKAPKTRAWNATTLGAVVNQIATEHGYTARLSPKFVEVAIAHLDQTNESDMHVLTRLARQYQAVTKPASGFLLFVERGTGKTASGQFLPRVTLRPTDVMTYRVTLPERHHYSAVQASYHDTASANRISVTAGVGTPVFELRRTYPTLETAQDAAQAKLEALRRGAGQLHLTLGGMALLVAEMTIDLSGFRSGVNGAWSVTRVEHRLDAEGYTCQIDAEVPTP